MVLTYRYLDLPPEDTRGVLGYLQRAFTQCAHAKPVPTVAGVTALRGSTWDVDPKVTTECVLLMTDRRVGWLLLEGSGWTSADRQRATRPVESQDSAAGDARSVEGGAERGTVGDGQRAVVQLDLDGASVSLEHLADPVAYMTVVIDNKDDLPTIVGRFSGVKI